MFRHQLRWALGAHVVGLTLVAVAVWFRLVPLGVAATMFLLSVGLGAKATMRCPFCQRSVAAEIIRWPWLWTSRVPQRCPHCGTDLEQEL
jgi:hypothetical protein